MSKSTVAVVVAIAFAPLACPPSAFAQQQSVRPPIAIYWVDAATAAGFGAGMGQGGMAGMMGRMMGGGGPQKTLDLRLGSSQALPAGPQAQHDIPPGMNMGASLPLVTPTQGRSEPAPGLPAGMEQPKGRMLIYWGCGDKAGPGQPVVLDFAAMASGKAPNLASRVRNLPQGPTFGRSKSFGEWPNPQDSRAVPPEASLRGDHLVKGNYSPDIRFTVDERRDFMPAVSVSSAGVPSGGRQVTWGAVTGATGYSLLVFGGREDGSEMVMWSSSAVQEMPGSLLDYIPPAEVARLVRERVVLPPEATTCTVPQEVMKATPMAMLQFIAYGDELNVVHPPRPQDPKVAWEQQYAVKVRLKSTAMLPLADGMEGMGRMGRGGDTGAPQTAGGEAAPAQGPGYNPVEEGVKEGLRTLRGLIGR
jgi:hypothetical protein